MRATAAAVKDIDRPGIVVASKCTTHTRIEADPDNQRTRASSRESSRNCIWEQEHHTHQKLELRIKRTRASSKVGKCQSKKFAATQPAAESSTEEERAR